MNSLTQFSIDPAGLSVGLSGLAGLESPIDGPPAALSFIAPVAPPAERSFKRQPATETDLSIQSAAGSAFLCIRDSRLFAPDRQAFCRALLESAVADGAFRRGEICVESATCRLEFDPAGLDRVQVAQRAAAAIRAATPSLDVPDHNLWRSGPDCKSVHAFATAERGLPSIWEIRVLRPARLRLRNRAHFGHEMAIRLADLLRMWPGITLSNCVPAQFAHEFDVEFDPEILTPSDVVLAAEAALRVARACEDLGSLSNPDRHSTAIDGLAGIISRDVLVAAGSMVLAVAGLILPGIPTVPFVVLGCHALGRAYPQLQPSLHSIPGLGQVLRASTANESQWSDPHILAKTLILGGLFAAFLVIVHPPFPLILACELGMMFFSIH
jgi:uncharacterized membrane protein YbaN (DUF454 family)